MAETQIKPLLEESIEIDATPETVWALIGDVSRMSRWSPQVVRTWVSGGETREGATFRNLNRKGLLFWPTSAKVVGYEPDRRLAFRVKDNWTIWTFELEPTAAGGTRLTNRRESPKGISGISLRLTDLVLGGQQDFTAHLEEGMRTTLARIKADLGG